MNYDFEDPRRFGFKDGEVTVEVVSVRDLVWRRGVGRSFEERFPPLSPAREAALREQYQVVQPVAAPPKQRRPDTPTTYLIGMEGSSLVKIGYTGGSPRKRLASLQTGQPMQLSLLWWCSGSYEADLHAYFDAYHHRGEWFDLSPLGDPVEAVRAAVAEIEAASNA